MTEITNYRQWVESIEVPEMEPSEMMNSVKGKRIVKRRRFRAAVSGVIFAVMITAFGSASVYAYNYVQRHIYSTATGIKVDDSITDEEKESDETIIGIDTSKPTHKEDVPEIENQECRSVDEAEAILGFEISQPKLEGYDLNAVYVNQTEGGAEKSITVCYKKGESFIEMTVSNMEGSNAWTFAADYSDNDTEKSEYTTKDGYKITTVEFKNPEEVGIFNALIAFPSYNIRINSEHIAYDEMTEILDSIDFSKYEGKGKK